MSLLHRLPGLIAALALAVAVGVGAWWLATHKPEEKKADKPPPGAVVVKEEEFVRVVVGEKAAVRIGLAVGAVEIKPVRRVRVYGGEVTIPDGRRIPVTASLAGVLAAPAGGMPKAGQAVEAGKPLFQLMPLLSPESRITMAATLATADGQVKTALARLDAAHVALVRARSAAAFSGNKAAEEAAGEAHKVAQQELEAAKANHEVLKRAVGELDKGTASPMPVLAPTSGILRVVTAQPGLTVASGAALCEVVDLSTVWVRLPLPVSDLDAVAKGQPALVGKLSAPSDGKTKPAPAEPVPAPPSANPLAGTVDLFYALPNAGLALSPGQRVGVTVPLADAVEAPTVPWSAVVLDINGGYWVFEETAPRTFTRRRVSVAYTDPADPAVAVLELNPTTPKPGTKVATRGVQELLGAETGFIK